MTAIIKTLQERLHAEHRLNTEFISQVHGLKVSVVVAVGSLPRTVPAEASNACCNYALINLALTLINKC